jgi:hypothetical protein
MEISCAESPRFGFIGGNPTAPDRVKTSTGVGALLDGRAGSGYNGGDLVGLRERVFR